MFEALLILAAGSAAHAADPLGEARAGKVQCVMPNDAAKKCLGISTYKINADGTFDSTTTLVIAPTPLITMTVTSPAGNVQGAALCSPVRKSEFETAKIEMDGQPAHEAVASAVRAQIVASIEAMDGKTSCATEAGDGSVAVTLDGVARPDMSIKAKWVEPGEYTLGQ